MRIKNAPSALLNCKGGRAFLISLQIVTKEQATGPSRVSSCLLNKFLRVYISRQCTTNICISFIKCSMNCKYHYIAIKYARDVVPIHYGNILKPSYQRRTLKALHYKK